MHEVGRLQTVEEGFNAVRESAFRRGTSITFGRSPSDRPKSAVWIEVERAGRSAGVIVWSSGEVELEAGGEGVVDLQEHHDVETSSQLVALLQHCLDLVRDR